MFTNEAHPTTIRGGLRGWTARRPVAAFLVLLFGIGYPVMSLPIMAARDVIPGGWLPQALGLDAERFASLLMIFLALLPAAVAVTWVIDGQVGVRTLVRRMLRWRFGARWWLVVLLGLPTLTITFAVLLGDTLSPTPGNLVSLAADQILGLVIAFLLINLWEETAWAGFVQTRLERRHSLAVAAILTAAPFAMIHLPFQFIGEFSANSLAAGFLVLLIVSMLLRLLQGVLLRGTRDSILAVALVHTVFNKSNNADGIVANLVPGEARGLAAFLAVVVLTAALSITLRGRLTRTYRLTLETSAYSPPAAATTGPATRSNIGQPVHAPGSSVDESPFAEPAAGSFR